MDGTLASYGGFCFLNCIKPWWKKLIS